MSEKLKPCPFCGGNGRTRQVKTSEVDEKFRPIFNGADKIYVIGCDTWDCILYLCDKSPRLIYAADKRDVAIKRWNRRAE